MGEDFNGGERLDELRRFLLSDAPSRLGFPRHLLAHDLFAIMAVHELVNRSQRLILERTPRRSVVIWTLNLFKFFQCMCVMTNSRDLKYPCLGQVYQQLMRLSLASFVEYYSKIALI